MTSDAYDDLTLSFDTHKNECFKNILMSLSRFCGVYTAFLNFPERRENAKKKKIFVKKDAMASSPLPHGVLFAPNALLRGSHCVAMEC